MKRYGVSWTVERAHTFVQALVHCFEEYNRVLWEGFSYCRECGGQCCVVDASDIRAFDLIAVALLDLAAPVLPQRVEVAPGACIYLNTTNGRPHCSWPDAWRTIKCWSFYCLGSGPWLPDADLGVLYRAVTTELAGVIRARLPDPLRQYEVIEGVDLTAHLDDPVEFSQQIHTALTALFVTPFAVRYPAVAAAQAMEKVRHTPAKANIFLADIVAEDAMLQFIGEALAEIDEGKVSDWAELSVKTLLSNLETLAWIVEYNPANRQALLQTLYVQYEHAPLETLWQRMREQIRRLI